MINQHFYIARLIARYLSDEIGEEEQVELTRWRDESPENERLFQEICKELDIVEHYLSCAPDGLLLLDGSGSAHLLVVQTEAMMRSHFEIADELGAPKELLQHLSNRRHIPYFRKTSGDYSPDYDDWKSCLHPAHEFTGQNGDWYMYAVINSPSAFNLKYIHSYGDYLEQLDAEARQGIPGR